MVDIPKVTISAVNAPLQADQNIPRRVAGAPLQAQTRGLRDSSAAAREAGRVEENAQAAGIEDLAAGDAAASTLNAIEAIGSALAERRQVATDRDFMNEANLRLTQRFAEIEAESQADSLDPDYVQKLNTKLATAQKEFFDQQTGEGGSYRVSQQAAAQFDALASDLRVSAARRGVATANNQIIRRSVNNSENRVREYLRALEEGRGTFEGAVALIDAEADTIAQLRGAPPNVSDDFEQAQNSRLDATINRRDASTRRKTSSVRASKARRANLDLRSQAWRDAAVSKATEAEFNRLMATGDFDGAEAFLDSQVSPEMNPEAPEQIKTIHTLSKEGGVDPILMVVIRNLESSGGKNVVSSSSSARGDYQLTEETATSLGLPKDASTASFEDQTKGAVALTADNTRILKAGIERTPTPADIYTAHFLGVGDATKVLKASEDPDLIDLPISDLLSKKVIDSNPQLLKGKTVGEVVDDIYAKVTAEYKRVSEGGFYKNDFIDEADAVTPVNTLNTLTKTLAVARKARAKAERKIASDNLKVQEGTHDDPGQHLITTNQKLQTAYRDVFLALANEDADPEEVQILFSRFVKKMDDAQDLLGVPARSRKLLPKSLSVAIRNSILAEDNGAESVKAQIGWQQKLGPDWARVQRQLVEEGLPASAQVQMMVTDLAGDPDARAATEVADASRLPTKQITEGMDPEEVSKVKKAVLVEWAPLRKILETGPWGQDVREQSNAMLETFQKVALLRQRKSGTTDVTTLARDVVSLMKDKYDIYSGSNIEAIIPKSMRVNGDELTRVARFKQSPSELRKFQPAIISSGEPNNPLDIDEERFFRTVHNSGVWVSNETGDGLMLVIPFGNGQFQTVQDKSGVAYEFKFDDVDFPEIEESEDIEALKERFR